MRALVMFLLFASALTAQTPEPWFGAWKLNPEKSTAEREVRYRRVTTKIEPWQDGVKVTYDLVGIRGGVTHMEWTGKFDGRDYPVQGVDYVMTNAYTRVNERSYEIAIKVDGSPTATATVVISPDNRTLTTVTKGANAQGNTVTTTAVYERQ